MRSTLTVVVGVDELGNDILSELRGILQKARVGILEAQDLLVNCGLCGRKWQLQIEQKEE